MRKMLGLVLTSMCASSVLALDNDDSIVRWKNVAGVITAPGVDNPVGRRHPCQARARGPSVAAAHK